MKPHDFHERALQWLRNDKHMRTNVLPGERLETERGAARVRGFFARAAAAGRWAILGLWMVTLGGALAMTNLPGFTPTTRTTVERAGYGGVVSGVACLAVAEIVRRRQRVPAVVELRSAESGPVTAKAIDALAADAQGVSAWVVAEEGFAPDAFPAAQARGVRCFVLDGDGFREAEQEPGPHRAA